MVDEAGMIRIYSPWRISKTFQPAVCLTESSRGAFDLAKNQMFDFLEMCTGAVCQPKADVVDISWLLSKLCGSKLQHEAVLKDWSSGFQICFYTWEVMKYLGTVGTTAKIWHGWFFANDGGLEVGYLILVKSSLGKEGWDQMNG